MTDKALENSAEANVEEKQQNATDESENVGKKTDDGPNDTGAEDGKERNENHTAIEPKAGNGLDRTENDRENDKPNDELVVTVPGIDREQNGINDEIVEDNTTTLTPGGTVQTPSNVRFSGSAKSSNDEVSIGKHLNIRNKSPDLSITGILNDIEFEGTSQTPPFTFVGEDQTEQTPRLSRDVDTKDRGTDSILPSITSTEVPKRRRQIKKRRAISPPKYYYEHRRIYHNRSRLTKVFTRPPQYALLKSEAHFIRMSKIVVTLGTMLLRDVLRTYIDRIYPPKDLPQFLQHYKRRFISFSSTDKLLNSRWKTLFPSDIRAVQLQQLDPALVFWFIRHLCHFKKSIDLIWKWKPAHNDHSIAADVSRIRDLRNGLLNTTELALYEDEFERKIDEFKKITVRLSGERKATEVFELITEIKKTPVKAQEREQYVDIMNKWGEETKDRNIEKIAPAKQDWETVRECKDMTKRFLKRFNRATVFVKTKIYQRAAEKLTNNGFVIIKGNTGEGKTTTALALMTSLYEPDDILVMSSANHWKYTNKHTVGAVLIDDLLGSMHFDEKQLTDWEGYFDVMYRGCGGKQGRHYCDDCANKKDRTFARVIITMRKHVFDQYWPKLSEYKLFDKDNVIDCSSSELQFSEKRAMLSRHLLADHKTRTEVDKSARLPNSKLGFPQSCALFVSQDAYLDLGSQFFEKPIGMLQHNLDDLYHKDMFGYLALVVMMFQPGAVLFLKRLEAFTDENLKRHVVELAGVCEVPVSEHLPAYCLLALTKSLKPYVYYYEDLACFSFVHESVMEIMMSTFVERHPQYVLETCALQFITDYVTTDETVEVPRDQLFMMKIRKHNFWLLTQLFEHYMSHGYVVKIAQHRAFRDPQFLLHFFNHIKKKEMKDEFVLQIDKNIKEPDEDRYVGFLYGAVDQDTPNVELAIAILRLGSHVRKPFSPEWCISELGSTLCVAVKRGNFAVYSALVATKIDIPDKLMTHMEYLTSLEIISDLLWKRQWSNEQKDIGLVRASRLATPEGPSIVSLLLQKGASVSSIRCGTTALCEAVKAGNAKTVSILLLKGASVYDRDLNDQSPLHHACDWDRVETAKLLLQKGADVNTKDTSGLSPFLVAAGWGRDEILQMLLAKRADPSAVDEHDNTCLHICAANGRAATMRAIIEAYHVEIHPLLTARNKYGWTPLDFAMKCGHLGVSKILVRAILHTEAHRHAHKTFVHTRFNIVKIESLDRNERCLHRFVDLDSERPCFQIPRGKWFIESGDRDEYEKITYFVSKYEDRLKQRHAKS